MNDKQSALLDALLATDKPYPDGTLVSKLYQTFPEKDIRLMIADKLTKRFPKALSANRANQIWVFGNTSKRLRLNGVLGYWVDLNSLGAVMLNKQVDITDPKVSGKKTHFIDR